MARPAWPDRRQPLVTHLASRDTPGRAAGRCLQRWVATTPTPLAIVMASGCCWGRLRVYEPVPQAWAAPLGRTEARAEVGRQPVAGAIRVARRPTPARKVSWQQLGPTPTLRQVLHEGACDARSALLSMPEAPAVFGRRTGKAGDGSRATPIVWTRDPLPSWRGVCPRQASYADRLGGTITVSMTWITPFVARMLAVMTVALPLRVSLPSFSESEIARPRGP